MKLHMTTNLLKTKFIWVTGYFCDNLCSNSLTCGQDNWELFAKNANKIWKFNISNIRVQTNTFPVYREELFKIYKLTDSKNIAFWLKYYGLIHLPSILRNQTNNKFFFHLSICVANTENVLNHCISIILSEMSSKPNPKNQFNNYFQRKTQRKQNHYRKD